MRKSYNTKQKDLIEQAVEKIGDNHFNAEQIFSQLKAENLTIGISTVYRHLDKLVSDGKIQKLATITGQSACYQKKNCAEKHFHLKCTACGALEHLSCEKLMGINKHVADQHGFKIDSSKTVFYGLCKDCR